MCVCLCVYNIKYKDIWHTHYTAICRYVVLRSHDGTKHVPKQVIRRVETKEYFFLSKRGLFL